MLQLKILFRIVEKLLLKKFKDSSYQSCGFVALSSGIVKGSSSSHPSGLIVLGSGISAGSFSFQSSGLTALGSLIFSLSSQSSGFTSLSSIISLGGLTGGLNVSASSKFP